MENKKKNTIALVGFILSFFTLIIGLICSIIGLKKSKELNDGKGFAIAGIIISAVKIVLVIFLSVIMFLSVGVILNSAETAKEKTDNLLHSKYCSTATECTNNYDGTYECRAKTYTGEIIDVTCDFDEVSDDIRNKD